ncbi:hypothetical protein M436DRAFT_60584 [Aureobasidium namibiae CBS 147.97]|uniref:Uncharacterized protein n=1 Tax=Aureobasidium namibiae CBS 147.97 TaxID=1043004 RepID=A0A074WZ51_9PEZI|nr:uncharacterized protein M436DRAFT_60584 [Aureobasidium namibiae CBS 147.97]KEQ76769.1 hypothetical protein M436DRAFT_60584 [Aureobasidium namibiae CBS 147.97]
MSPLLEYLINAGEISDKCLHCHQQLESCELFAACEILTALAYQQIHDLDYQAKLWKLAKYSFCRQVLSSTSGSKSGSVGSQETRTESQKRKARRTCAPRDLVELALKVKQMGRDTDDFQKRISVLKLELQTERNQRELLQHEHERLQCQHTQMVDIAATQYAELFADGTARIAKLEHREAELIADGTARIAKLEHRNAYLIADGTARIADLESRNAYLLADGTSRLAELMQKITGLEAQNSCLQQQLQSERAIDHTDIAMMVGTIKELNAGLSQCSGELYKMRLTPTSRHVVETLEPM